MTSPASGASAPRRRLTQRLLATSVAVASVAALVIGGPLSASARTASLAEGAGGVSSAATSPSPTPSTEPALRLSLAPGSNGVLRAGQPLDLTAVIENPTDRMADTGRVSVALGSTALLDAGALDRWLDGDETGVALAEVAAGDVPATEPDARTSAALSVAPDDARIAGRAPGVYPLRATATIGSTTLQTESVVVVPDDAAPPAPLGIVVPVAASPAETGLIDSDRLTALTAVGGELTSILDAVEGTPAILAIDPAIPAAIRVLGSAAPATAVEWLDRLLALPNSRFALQFADADLASQMQAGLAAPLQPTTLQAYMSPADFAGAVAADQTPGATPAADATETPDGPAYPDLATLLDIGPHALLGVYWPATGSAGSDVVAALGSSAADAGPPLTLLSSSSVPSGASSARATAGAAQVLLYDQTSSDALHAASGINAAVDRGAALATATAALSFAAASAAGQPLLATVDRGTDRSAASLRAAITAALTAPGVTPVALGELAGATPTAVETVPVEADAARVTQLGDLLSDEGAIGAFSSILDDPTVLTGPERAELLQLISVAWRDDPDAATAAVASHRTATAATLDSVGILSTSVLLASAGGDLRPYVRNDLAYPVTVELAARPDGPSLVVQERTTVRASPDSNTRFEIPVESQVGNGVVDVSMQLYSPTGVAVGAAAAITVDVHAEWETIGLVALVAILLLLLVGGIIRTVRRRRARRAEQDAAAAGPADDADAQHPEVSA